MYNNILMKYLQIKIFDFKKVSMMFNFYIIEKDKLKSTR